MRNHLRWQRSEEAMSYLTASEKAFLTKLRDGDLVLRIDQAFAGTGGWIYKRPDFLLSVQGHPVLVEVKPIGAEITGEEYHRILNTSLGFGIPAVIVWAGDGGCEFACVTRPVPNDGVVEIPRKKLVTIEDILPAIQQKDKESDRNG